MVIKIKASLPDGKTVYVKCNNEEKMLDTENDTLMFTVDSDNIEVNMDEKASVSNHSLGYIVLFLLTWPIQGVFNILLFNVGREWYNKITAYYTKVSFTLALTGDTLLDYKLFPAKRGLFDTSREYPQVEIYPNINYKIEYIKNPMDFSNQFFNYVKRLVSVAGIAEALFVLILFSLVKKHILGICVITVLIFGTAILTAVIINREYKRYKKMLIAFLNDQ